MRMGRMLLCFPDGDRIIVDRLPDLAKYNMDQVSAVDVTLSLSMEEFAAIREQCAASEPKRVVKKREPESLPDVF